MRAHTTDGKENMMKEQEVYGDAVETNKRMHQEALRRARVRNEDMNTYSEAERASALPAPEQQLNWAGGSPVMTPSAVPAEQFTGLQSTPRVDGGLSGVDAICGHSDGRK